MEKHIRAAFDNALKSISPELLKIESIEYMEDAVFDPHYAG